MWMQTECCGDGGGCSCRVGRSCPWCDVELSLFIKVSSPFLLYLSLAYLISLRKSCKITLKNTLLSILILSLLLLEAIECKAISGKYQGSRTEGCHLVPCL
jgi:hypothetical protein